MFYKIVITFAYTYKVLPCVVLPKVFLPSVWESFTKNT